jgi:two-component system NtrC family sensor kinase
LARSANTHRRPVPSASIDNASFLSRILDLMRECVVVADASGHIVYVSRAAEQVLGYPPDELLHKHSSTLGLHLGHPRTLHARTVDSGTPEKTGPFRRKDGRTVSISSASHLIPSSSGNESYYVTILSDATGEWRLKEQLLQSEKMSALGQLVSGVAHDLNNPLSSIMGYAQLLSAQNADPGFRRALEVIGSESMRASRIVKNLLTFARKSPPERTYLGLNGLVLKTLELKVHDFQMNRIAVQTDLEPGLPLTLIDFHQIQQVLLNLLINAEQAMRSQKDAGALRIVTRKAGIGIQVSIEDDGPGIPHTALQKVFEPFFTTKPIGVGTGLGLAICHGIVAEHGGTISAQNRPEGGARFVIELPILTPDEAPSAGEGSKKAFSPKVPRKDVLVIDDDAAIQDMLVAFLTFEGHKVDTATTAEVATQKISARHYDVILTDLRLGGMTGIEFYEHLQEKDPAMARRIVFITGDLVNPETLEFLDRVKNFCLSKPFTLDDLRTALTRLDGSVADER